MMKLNLTQRHLDEGKGVAWTLVIAFSGATVSTAFGLPAAVLLGAMSATFLAALVGLPVAYPTWLQSMVIVIIGINIGGTLDIASLAGVAKWSPSLLGLLVAQIASLFCVSVILRNFGRTTAQTAFFAAFPGHLEVVIQEAGKSGADVRQVTVSQSLRIAALVAVLPSLLKAVSIEPAGSTQIATDWLDFMIVAVTGVMGAGIAHAIRLPAANIIGSIVGAGVAALAGFSIGQIPVTITQTLMLLTGAMIGCQFIGGTLTTLGKLLPISIAGVAAAIAITALLAVPISAFIDVPFGQLLLAYAPGGADIMALLAIAMGFDPAFVGLHHVARLVVTAAALPLFVRNQAAHNR
jgi:membrane AbrB-like protein